MLPMLVLWSMQSLIKTAAPYPGFHESKAFLEEIALANFSDLL